MQNINIVHIMNVAFLLSIILWMIKYRIYKHKVLFSLSMFVMLCFPRERESLRECKNPFYFLNGLCKKYLGYLSDTTTSPQQFGMQIHIC